MTETQTGSSQEGRRTQDGLPGAALFAPLLCLIGLCISTYLAVLHYGLIMGDLSLGGVCGGGTWGDCNSVVASRYGKLLGLPVSIWGMWYYIVAGTFSLGILLLRREDTRPFVRALLWLTGAALVFDVYLGWAMWQRVERLCPLCAVTYGINVLILLVAVHCRRKLSDVPGRLWALLPSMSILVRPADSVYYREALKVFLLGMGGGACLLVLAISFLVSRSVLEAEKDELANLLEYLPNVRPFYVETAGQPSRGPDDAPLTLVVFSDFLCEQCKLAHDYVDIVAANHRDSMRVAYLNYPVDTECNEYARKEMHPGACTLARAGECAHRQGMFWEFHDTVFAEPGVAKPEQVTDYATRSGLDVEKFEACLVDGQTGEAVRTDIALAHSVGVTATPTGYINGRPVIGALKPWMLEAAIEAIEPLPLPSPPPTSDE